VNERQEPFGLFRDYETARRFEFRDGRIYAKGGYEVWPDDEGCVCQPEWAEWDELGGAIFVQFTPGSACPVHAAVTPRTGPGVGPWGP
jgi:hypothetical protein